MEEKPDEQNPQNVKKDDTPSFNTTSEFPIYSLIETIIPTPKSEEKSDNPKTLREESEAIRIGININRLLAIFTCGLLLANIGIIYQNRILIVDNRQNNNSNYIQTQHALKTADSSLSISRLHMDTVNTFMGLDMRAYLTIKPSIFTGTDTTAKFGNTPTIFFQVLIDIQNTGRTPAYNVVDSIERIDTAIIPYAHIPKFTIRTFSTSPPMIGATISVPIGYQIERMPISHLDSLLYQKRSIFIYGSITYDDIFKKHHHVHFYEQYSFQIARFYPVGDYNDAD